MSEVKRYELSSLPLDDDGVFQVAQEWADGNYVLFTDFESERLAHADTKAKLEALRIELQEEIEDLDSNYQEPIMWSLKSVVSKIDDILNSQERANAPRRD